ncbi:hypothetical protein TNIN_34801 [Trichonephila inaurata madagascariensis]|uniref:Uncharacterized protein n=1 Tax=Trichonephila inaurata madagascariensis TaxID=2747483 RepID=A0A8X7BMS1_9ARAC|nr:hypothetical protein TNIN_396681 [Trichonephila inaurata madagascariensis]GFY51291.1 hypothetical protein TNIN_34801 [Trichonephila inaurata madagascariensis]
MKRFAQVLGLSSVCVDASTGDSQSERRVIIEEKKPCLKALGTQGSFRSLTKCNKRSMFSPSTRVSASISEKSTTESAAPQKKSLLGRDAVSFLNQKQAEEKLPIFRLSFMSLCECCL